MAAISGGQIMPGYGLYTFPSAPVTGTSAVQTLSQASGTITGGTFRLGAGGSMTAPLAYNAVAATIDTALEALPGIGTGNVVVGGGPLPGTPLTFTFSGGRLANTAVPLLQVDGSGLVGGTVTLANTTPGVPASGAGALQGALGIDTTSGIQYSNVGGTWTKTGTQTLMARTARAGEEPEEEEADDEEPEEEAPPDETDDQRRDREQRREERRQRREERRAQPTPHESTGPHGGQVGKSVKKPPEDKGASGPHRGQ